ncbi:hypothetical protein RF55_9816 [Lasius niger]|uniref:Uncharacterized protein n=1 Tax=Lasius niger TaxID=67767 RepID=A0A0J7NCY1_LASNI|nr:hypothetical protein RF55_9816 [Lasius niger]
MSFQLRRFCSTRFPGVGSAAGPEDALSLGLSLGVRGFGLGRGSFIFLVRPWSKIPSPGYLLQLPIAGVKLSHSIDLTLAGRISNDGSCKGTQYSDPYGTWDEVVVQAVVKISLKSSHAPVQLNSGKIILKSGTVCILSESFCLDSDDGYTYWKPIPTSSCNFHQYDVLYEGPATKITDDTINPSAPVIYSLTTQDVTFALTKTKKQPLCGYTLLRTEHPKLFILETKKGDTFANRGIIPVDNLDYIRVYEF